MKMNGMNLTFRWEENFYKMWSHISGLAMDVRLEKISAAQEWITSQTLNTKQTLQALLNLNGSVT